MERQTGLEEADLGEDEVNRVSLIHPRAERPDPGIEATMQALSIHEPEIVHIQAGQQMQEKGQDAEFNILMKLAVTGGTVRVLSLQAVQQSMARAWRDNYYGISQLSRHIFVAHFRSLEAAMFVITRQPWSMGSDNFLIEWMDPEDHGRNIHDYKFDTIYVTIRVYGIPMRFRSHDLLINILQSVGQLSEFHPLSQSMISARQEYMWGTIRAKVSESVRDKVWVSFAKDSAGWAYLFYKRIGRICTFCGVMFHSVQHCTARNSLLMLRNRLQISLEQISPNRFGQWMTNVGLIPGQSEANIQGDSNSFSSFLNPQLARLQRQFIEDSKGKEKGSDEGVLAKDNYKELSLRKINEQIKRMEGGSASNNSELQLSQRKNEANTVSPNFIQGVCPSQSGAIMQSVRVGLVPSVAVTTELIDKRCNNAGDKLIESSKDQVQQCTTLSHPVQSGGANNQLLLGKGCTTTQDLPVIPSSSNPDTSRQHEFINPLPHPNFPSLHAEPAIYITQATPASAIPALMVDKNLSGNTTINPVPTQGVSSSPSRRPPTSPLRSNPKRPSESLLGLPLPPTKKVVPHGAGESRDGLPSSVSHAGHRLSLLGAPPSRSVLLGQPSLAGDLGATAGAFAGDAVQSVRRTPNGGPMSGAALPRSTASQGSRHRSGGSRWDIPPAGGSRGNNLRRNRDSTGTVSSCQGAFSPTGIDRFHQMDLDVDRGMTDSGAQITMKNQDDFSTFHQGDTIAFRNGQLGEDMDFDSEVEKNMADSFSWAAAHGPNAPRAP